MSAAAAKPHGECPRCHGPVCPEGWGWAPNPTAKPECYCIECAAALLKTSVDTLRPLLAGRGGKNVCSGHVSGMGPCPLMRD